MGSRRTCPTCGKEHPKETGAICGGTNTRYCARVRYEGNRNYESLGKGWVRSSGVALKRLAAAMATGKYKRGEVLMATDYYDPEVIYEIVRR